jgi:hypothetical protein
MKTARLDPALTARIVARQRLTYEPVLAQQVGAPWVRAGSALARFGKRLIMVQDDALWLAWWDPQGRLHAEALPADETALLLFNDKRRKPDFEAAVVIGDRLFVFGSGSLPSRERIAIVENDGRASLFHAAALYASLRQQPGFAGRQLNVEGALVDSDKLVLFTRGNADALAAGSGYDASVELDLSELERYCRAPTQTPPPLLGAVSQYRLGELDGVRLTLTDAVFESGTRYYVAAAEASPDAVADGEVLGTSFGVLDADPRYALILREDGELLRDKVEGLAAGAEAGQWLLITDPDDASRPAELLTLRVS